MGKSLGMGLGVGLNNNLREISSPSIPAPENEVDPVVSGGVLIGGPAFSVTTGTWSNANSYTYQWYRTSGIISGQTNQTKSVVGADIGQDVWCVVTAIGDGGSTPQTSNSLSVPEAVNTSAPSISGLGTTDSGSYGRLTRTQGTWNHNPNSRTSSWYRDGVLIVGAASAVYDPVSDDEYSDITYKETANYSGGDSVLSDESNGIVAKPDLGRSWILQDVGASNGFNRVLAAGNGYLMTGDTQGGTSRRVRRSTDGGDNWSTGATNLNTIDMVWCQGFNTGSGYWIQSEGSNVQYSSNNGTSWSTLLASRTHSLAYNPTANRVVGVNNSQGSGASANFTFYSNNGTSTTTGTGPDNVDCSKLIWVEDLGIYVAVHHTSTNLRRVWTSTDGITWTQRITPVSGRWLNVVWNPVLEKLVAIVRSTDSIFTSQTLIVTSPDGVTWTQEYAFAVGVAWGNTVPCALQYMEGRIIFSVGDVNSLVYSSDDLTNWVSVPHLSGFQTPRNTMVEDPDNTRLAFIDNAMTTYTSKGSLRAVMAPVVTGNTLQGSVLSCSTGTWGGVPTGFTYAWYTGVTLLGTGDTYTILGSDVGNSLFCVVTATDDNGDTIDSANSNSVVAEAFDADSQEYISRIISNGGTVTYEEEVIAHDGFKGLKDLGVYNKIYRLSIPMGNGLLAAEIPWVNTKGDTKDTLTGYGGGQWSRASGLQSNGSSYIRTGWTPNSVSEPTATLIVRYNGLNITDSAQKSLCGCRNAGGTNHAGIFRATSSTRIQTRYMGNAGPTKATDQIDAGTWGVTWTSTTDQTLYRQGEKLHHRITGSALVNGTVQMYVGALNANGTANDILASGYIGGYAFFEALTDEEYQDVMELFAGINARLGRALNYTQDWFNRTIAHGAPVPNGALVFNYEQFERETTAASVITSIARMNMFTGLDVLSQEVPFIDNEGDSDYDTFVNLDDNQCSVLGFEGNSLGYVRTGWLTSAGQGSISVSYRGNKLTSGINTLCGAANGSSFVSGIRQSTTNVQGYFADTAIAATTPIDGGLIPTMYQAVRTSTTSMNLAENGLAWNTNATSVTYDAATREMYIGGFNNADGAANTPIPAGSFIAGYCGTTSGVFLTIRSIGLAWSKFNARYGRDDDNVASWKGRIAAAGGSTNSSEDSAVNAAVVAMKSDGYEEGDVALSWWDIQRWNPMMGSNLAAIAEPVHRGGTSTSTTSPNLPDTLNNYVIGDWNRVTGLQGNGSTKYFNTKTPPNISSQSGRVAVIVTYNGSALTTSRTLFGSNNASDAGKAVLRASSGTQLFIQMNSNIGAGGTITSNITSGVWTLTRISIGSLRVYKELTQIGLYSTTATITNNGKNIILGALDNNGSIIEYHGTNERIGGYLIVYGLTTHEATIRSLSYPIKLMNDAIGR